MCDQVLAHRGIVCQPSGRQFSTDEAMQKHCDARYTVNVLRGHYMSTLYLTSNISLDSEANNESRLNTVFSWT